MQAEIDQELERRLRAWSRSARVEGPLGGGYRNRLWAVRVGGRRYAARLSARPAPALDWEIGLLRFLRAADMRAPEALGARDGRSHVDGLVLFSWLDGHPPGSERDWRLVAGELDRLHTLTRGWPQRPGFRSSQQLLEERVGGDVRLDLMPEDAVRRVRAAWRALAGEPTSVVHGDLAAGNILLEGGRAGLVDWDEARVDVSLFDLALLPLNLSRVLGAERMALARRAAVAWEAANGWAAEPAYARRRLAELGPYSDAANH
jgi:Ser/Thr protein kinase RdoA (MazF antagonist)